MYTVIETPVYAGKVEGILTDDEREAFAVFIAQNPIPVHELKLIKEVIDRDQEKENEFRRR